MARILMVASEGLPFIKSGGLADVIGSLPQELVKKGHEVRVVLPMYLKMEKFPGKNWNRWSRQQEKNILCWI